MWVEKLEQQQQLGLTKPTHRPILPITSMRDKVVQGRCSQCIVRGRSGLKDPPHEIANGSRTDHLSRQVLREARVTLSPTTAANYLAALEAEPS